VVSALTGLRWGRPGSAAAVRRDFPLDGLGQAVPQVHVEGRSGDAPESSPSSPGSPGDGALTQRHLGRLRELRSEADTLKNEF